MKFEETEDFDAAVKLLNAMEGAEKAFVDFLFLLIILFLLVLGLALVVFGSTVFVLMVLEAQASVATLYDASVKCALCVVAFAIGVSFLCGIVSHVAAVERAWANRLAV